MAQRRDRKPRTIRPQRGGDQNSVSDASSLGEQAATSANLSSKIDASLRERARKIIAKLEATSARREATTLEAWMAHYIAELMHRAEDPAAAASERATAARECADVVHELWQLQVTREQARLGYAIYQDRWREAPNTSSGLAGVFRRPSSVANWSALERLVALFALAQLDEELIRALYLATLRRQAGNAEQRSQRPQHETTNPAPGTGPRSEPRSDADAAGQRDSQEQGMREDYPDPKDVQAALDRAIGAVGTLFPEIAKADPSDMTGFNAVIVSALERTFRLRARLLGTPRDVEEVDRRRGAPRSRRAERAQPKKSTARKQKRRS